MTIMPQALAVDHGGVLTPGGGRGTNENAAMRRMGLNDLKADDLPDRLKLGRITNAGYVDGLNKLNPEAPHPLTMEMWDDVYATMVPDRKAYKFIRMCRAKGVPVVLLSNINEGIARRLKTDGSYKGFDGVVLSCDVHFAKPSPQIYAAVEKHLRAIDPSRILMIDDQEKCVKGARDRGWHPDAVKVDSTDQMIRDVSKLLGF